VECLLTSHDEPDSLIDVLKAYRKGNRERFAMVAVFKGKI
jgi:hypothetical protein